MTKKLKRCSKCRRYKKKSLFWVRQNICKHCSTITTKKYFVENHVGMKRYFKRREEIAKFKDEPCVDCGHKYPACVMDFDHVRGKKLFQISQAINVPWDKLLKEMQKCELVCANCHRIREQNKRDKKRKQHGKY